ncbi:MAG TPA: PIN domain-containing protein [Nitrospira sp.]|nr:PIN domain-containing protein [Nitrospira sp.]
MERRRWSVFLDTSALIAGLISPTGAAHEVLRLCEAGVVQAVMSRQILVEADRNLAAKMPTLLPDYRLFLKHLAPSVVEDPFPDAVERAGAVIHRNDAPILAAAVEAQVDFLITWNTRHFHKLSVRAYAKFPILTPGEFLEAFRQPLLKE